MSQFKFKLPDVGEGIAEAEIARWRVKVGETVTEDQPLVDVLTDKAAVEVPSPVAGKIVTIKGKDGDKVAIGSVIVVIETAGGAAEEKPQATKPAAAAASPAKPAAATATTAPGPAQQKPMASPATRRRARERGIDLAQVPPSGRGGRITAEDLEAFAAGSATPAATRAAAPPRDEIEEIKIIGLRRKIAEAMQRSKQRIPHFAYVEELDVTELEALRVHLNDNKRPEQAKLTLLPFLMRALVRAVPEFPQVNSTFDDEAGVVKRYRALHVGIATQTPNGLMVPVVKHAQQLDLWGAAAAIKRLAESARSGKATRDELTGSTITITSLGAMGGIASTPIINAPEVAIIGVNKMVERPIVHGGHIAVRKMMNLSSSFDHRIVDGWDAASFIQRVKALLEHPTTLFMP